MNNHNVLILILIYNGLSDTIDCLESLRKLSYERYGILIVDNNSQDNSYEYLKKNYRDVEIIRNSENLGYADGNNIGIQYFLAHSQYSHLLIINNDIEVESGLLEKLLSDMDSDSEIGIIGPVNYGFYDRNRILFNFATLSLERYRFFISQELQKEALVETAYVNGCCMLIKRDTVVKVGGFKGEYFLYWEESDLCYRAKESGYKCMVSQSTRIYHKDGATTGSLSPLKVYYLNRNRFLFFKINGMFKKNIYIYSLYSFLVHIFTNKGNYQNVIKAYVKAIADFQRAKFGKQEL